ncbi:Hypothetical protein D9617_2g052060 [Elsinoe fawcettii]|nr:Hypothetical protein D9617_2g052060 [Elsinoe fawcettii]
MARTEKPVTGHQNAAPERNSTTSDSNKKESTCRLRQDVRSLCINCHSIARDDAVCSDNGRRSDPVCEKTRPDGNTCKACEVQFGTCRLYSESLMIWIKTASEARSKVHRLRQEKIGEREAQMVQAKQHVHLAHKDLRKRHATHSSTSKSETSIVAAATSNAEAAPNSDRMSIDKKLNRLLEATDRLNEEVNGLREVIGRYHSAEA